MKMPSLQDLRNSGMFCFPNQNFVLVYSSDFRSPQSLLQKSKLPTFQINLGLQNNLSHSPFAASVHRDLNQACELTFLMPSLDRPHVSPKWTEHMLIKHKSNWDYSSMRSWKDLDCSQMPNQDCHLKGQTRVCL